MLQKMNVLRANMHTLRSSPSDTASTRRLRQAFYYLSVQGAATRLINDQRSLDSLAFIHSTCLADSVGHVSDLAAEYQFAHVATDLMGLLTSRLEHICASQAMDPVQQCYSGTFLKIACVLSGVLRHVTEHPRFCESWAHSKGSSVLFGFLNSQPILDKYFADEDGGQLLQPALDSILATIANVQSSAVVDEASFEVIRRLSDRRGIAVETQVLALVAMSSTPPVQHSFSKGDAPVVDNVLELLAQWRTSSGLMFKAQLECRESRWSLLGLLGVLKTTVLSVCDAPAKRQCHQVVSSLLERLGDEGARQRCREVLALVGATAEGEDPDQGEQILISCVREDKELCQAIKVDLEKLGFLVWMDCDATGSLKLDAMAEGIERSFCVLMCVSDRYKEDAKGRSEAEYAFLLGKPIIPLIMQKDYKPSGWLGKRTLQSLNR